MMIAVATKTTTAATISELVRGDALALVNAGDELWGWAVGDLALGTHADSLAEIVAVFRQVFELQIEFNAEEDPDPVAWVNREDLNSAIDELERLWELVVQPQPPRWGFSVYHDPPELVIELISGTTSEPSAVWKALDDLRPSEGTDDERASGVHPLDGLRRIVEGQAEGLRHCPGCGVIARREGRADQLYCDATCRKRGQLAREKADLHA